MNRSERAKIAEETLLILAQGYYVSGSGRRTELEDQIAQCLAGSAYFEPEALERLENQANAKQPGFHRTQIAVANETTLAGARRLVAEERFQRIGVLNFASAKRPGGGFLNGSEAQEESLARSSALYASLMQQPQFYAYHRQQKQSSYSDRLIYSPDCPVFRDDAGSLLDAPYVVDFITGAAPNAGSMGKRARESIPSLLRRRAGKVLALAVSKRCDALVLGAWGCGVFRNDPKMVAAIFGELLLEGGLYFQRFRRLHFSVLDATPQETNMAAFTHVFAADSRTTQ